MLRVVRINGKCNSIEARVKAEQVHLDVEQRSISIYFPEKALKIRLLESKFKTSLN